MYGNRAATEPCVGRGRQRPSAMAPQQPPTTLCVSRPSGNTATECLAKRRRLLCKQPSEQSYHLAPHARPEVQEPETVPSVRCQSEPDTSHASIPETEATREACTAATRTVADHGNSEQGDLGEPPGADSDVELIAVAQGLVSPGEYLIEPPAFDAADFLGYSPGGAL